MAKKKRLSPNQKAELKRDLAGLKTITGYAPAKPEFKTEEVEAIDAQLDTEDEEIDQMEVRLEEKRGDSADSGTKYKKIMKGVRQQVIAQFGEDSPEYEAVGGTRTSNRKTGLHRGTGNNTPNG